ncbi:MAG: 4-hydroxybutyrate CoA-transferase [Alphaproteobacteria bacterium]|nr:4-hydroxybutyrate CoA-transferase [Alphaproteobacteria bacterium]MDE1986806.1 4-hydroxybutyrate CoA-transferase [Alphaproteobacteria bacterium]MDE2163701.1 4-hydroxybutyrate CoA-transferase [Alphaproteobacteria bacterium]MDE2267170.1 4-hydroxybutyrate CoA-transferase [Alphaproteobacteria bacterium]
MSTRMSSAPAKKITAAEAAALVQSGYWLDFGACLAQPDVFDQALAARVRELSNVGIRSSLAAKPRAVLESDPEGNHFHYYTWHFSAYERAKADAGICYHMPPNLGEINDYYRRFIAPIDIVVLKVRPADANGHFNFGPTNAWFRTLVERTKTLIVETSTAVPHVHGVDNGIHISEVDYIIDGDNAPLPELKSPLITDVDRAVARRVAAEVEDGACLQIGIGGMPNAVCSLLLESGAKDLGVHTEMLTDGLIELYKAGVVTGARKKLDIGKVVFTFGLGTKFMYDAINDNPDMLCCGTEHTNLPHVIMQNDKVFSINSTTQMDLQGQAASESDGHRHISGTGGQLQYARGAYASNGGKSFMCLSSVFEKKGVRKSRIVLDLTPGNIVTTPRTDIMYVVTEYGVVNLKGKSVAERAQAMISLAHPDFREELERQAHENRLIPRAIYLPQKVARESRVAS